MAIGVITNDQDGAFQKLILSGIKAAADERGYRVTINSLLQDKKITLNTRALDGMIAIANVAPADFLREVYQRQIPLSLVSHHLPDLPIPSVTFNQAQGIAALVKHLVINCQRQHLVFVRGVPDQIDARQREAAFRQELMRYHLTVPETHFIHGDFTGALAVLSLQALIESGANFDAILASDYVMADAIVQHLRLSGIPVPQQVSVVGFGDAAEAETAGITTVAADVQELGKRAAYQLISQIEGLKIRGITTLSVELVIRATCGYQTG